VRKRPVRQIAVLAETDDTWGRQFVLGVAEHAQTHGPWMLLIEPRDHQGRLRLPDGWSGDGIIARLSSRAMAEQVRRAGLPAVDVLRDRRWYTGRRGTFGLWGV